MNTINHTTVRPADLLPSLSMIEADCECDGRTASECPSCDAVADRLALAHCLRLAAEVVEDAQFTGDLDRETTAVVHAFNRLGALLNGMPVRGGAL